MGTNAESDLAGSSEIHSLFLRTRNLEELQSSCYLYDGTVIGQEIVQMSQRGVSQRSLKHL